MKIKMMAAVMALTLSLTACQHTGQPIFGDAGTKESIGTVGGAVLGGVLGSKVGGGSGQLWATGAGALLGAYVGNSIGQSLDRADMAYYNRAADQAHSSPIGQTINWQNPESGNRGSITPLRQGTSSSGATCREYQQTIVVDGRAETAKGTACRNADGTWQLAN